METVSAGTQVAVLMARLTGLGEWEMGHGRAAKLQICLAVSRGSTPKAGGSRQKNTPHLAGYVVWPVGLDLRAYLAGICSSTWTSNCQKRSTAGMCTFSPGAWAPRMVGPKETMSHSG